MRTLKSSDLFQMRWVRSPALSPDGTRAAFVIKEVADDTSYNYRLMITEVGEPKEGPREILPAFSGSFSALQWSPCGGRLAFLSGMSGRNQIWLYDFASGRLGRLTDSPLGVREFVLSPDGESIAFAASVRDESGEYGEYVEGAYRVTRRLLYKTDGVGYWRCTWSQVWMLQCPGEIKRDSFEEMTGYQLTDSPHNHGSLTFSPDGQRIAMVSTREEDPDRSPYRNLFVMQLSADSSHPEADGMRQVTSDMVVSSAEFSPGGEYVAFIGHDNCEDRATTTGVWVTDVEGQRLVNLTADIDRPAGDYISDDMNADLGSPRPRWNEAGDTIMTLMSDSGCTYPVTVSFPGDEAFELGCARSHLPDVCPHNPWQNTQFSAKPLLAGDRRVFAFCYQGKDELLFAESTPHNPGDLMFARVDEEGSLTDKTALTSLNANLLARVNLAELEPVNFTGSEQRTIGGWLLLPPAQQGPYPLVLHVHGGPHAAYSPAFNFELQHLAAEGYAVLYTNPHGSHTYGRDINMGTRLDWGGRDYSDLMKAVDEVIGRPDIDADRLGVAGGSYGGWMTNYIVTRTDRFRAAVAQRSSSNRISTFAGSAVGFRHARWEAPGPPWEHLDYFCRISPVLHADRVTTPLLLVHAEFDHLCPLTQAEEMYTALKSLGKTVELLTFLEESHHLGRVGKPQNRMVRVDRTAEWFHRYM